MFGPTTDSSRLSEFDPPGVFPSQTSIASNFARMKEIHSDGQVQSSAMISSSKENIIGNVSPPKAENAVYGKLSHEYAGGVSPPTKNRSPNKYSETEKSILASRLDQLEREKRELYLQSKIREENEKALSSHNALLEERVKKLEADSEQADKELNLSRQEILQLRSEKDNLAAEVRKLTRQNSQTEGQSLWGQMTAASRELCRAEEEIKALNREVLEARERNAMLSRLQEKYEVKEKASELTLQELMAERRRRGELEGALQEAQSVVADLRDKLAESEASCEALRETAQFAREKHESELHQCRLDMAELQESLRAARSSGSEYDDDGNIMHSRKRRLSEAVSADTEFGSVIADLRQQLLHSESQRRKLHNKIQDLRGNVRVYVRCRPFLVSDGEDSFSDKCITCNAEGTTVSLSEHCSRGAGQVFQFDSVYSLTSRQEDLFADVKDLVQSALDGYRVCVFSYGQTGSGKTHTMTGALCGEDRGLIPRSIEHIITQINALKETGWHVRATYSMLEVYNETLVDLLNDNSSGDYNSQQSKGTKLKISMQHDRVVVQHLTAVPMNCESVESGMEQLGDILLQTNSARTTASTAMNERSSRSHVLFMMNVQSIHEDGTVMEGGLRLVDLAGSERLDRTGTLADAARLRETVNINKSLSCLGDVFMALGQKASHVPYRNSKLTMLLQVPPQKHTIIAYCNGALFMITGLLIG